MDTQLVLSNPLDISFESFDKDVLILSLFDYICKKKGQISPKKYTQQLSPKRNELKEKYLTILEDLLKNQSIELTDSYNVQTYHKRYAEDFIEIKKIGEGGYGLVYEAYNKLDDNVYAVKKIPILEKYNEINLSEIRSLSKLNHPNIVRYYTSWFEMENTSNLELYEDFIEEDKALVNTATFPILYIQMELCDTTLKEYFNKRNYSGKLINVEKEKKLFIQILDALKYIHENDIVHKDINPNNIFIKDGNVKIGDFGLCQNNETDESSPGNTLYTAPDTIITKASDIYSLGLILVEHIFPFSTTVERYKVIEMIKKNNYSMLDTFDKEIVILIKQMTHVNHKKRPTASFILDSIIDI